MDNNKELYSIDYVADNCLLNTTILKNVVVLDIHFIYWNVIRTYRGHKLKISI